MDGILVINKPAGYTSHDCIAVLRGITGIRKLGHTGTLDPNATGVLPVCMGKATKLIEYMDAGFKSYRAGIRFGTETDTQDIWGKVLERTGSAALPASFEEVAEAIGVFLGEQLQTPPAYSAV
ncbi:MAG: tRNA pseudouridine(55) synthase, partial [Firmicutes bacterium]|nr:tRNA pseudouridine(55) synthase [Bacillota bacterium]